MGSPGGPGGSRGAVVGGRAGERERGYTQGNTRPLFSFVVVLMYFLFQVVLVEAGGGQDAACRYAGLSLTYRVIRYQVVYVLMFW